MKKLEHLENLIGSLDKMFLNARNKGVIKNKELYLLNLIAKLLKDDCFAESNNQDQSKLNSIYYKILNKYPFLCKTELERTYYFKSNNINPTFEVNENCVTEPEIYNKIYYWQSEETKDNIEDIKLLINQSFLDAKQFDTYQNFETGKTITYNNIGRICFLDSNSSSLNYEIKDSLGNITTDQYDIQQLPNNQVLIVSKNIMSFGDLFIKIKKITNNNPTPITSGIFEDTFGIEFE